MLVSEHIFLFQETYHKDNYEVLIQQDQNMIMLTIQKLWTVR